MTTAVAKLVIAMAASGKPYSRTLTHEQLGTLEFALAWHQSNTPEVAPFVRSICEGVWPSDNADAPWVMEWDEREFGVVVYALNGFVRNYLFREPLMLTSDTLVAVVRVAGRLLVEIANDFGEPVTLSV